MIESGSKIRSDITPRTRLWIPALLLLIYVLQCAWFIRTQSLTTDEPQHLDSGLAIWHHGDFTVINDQPPLERVLGAAILAATGTTGATEKGRHGVLLEPERTSLLSRPLIIPLGILLAMLVWSTCRRWFSESAANFALALFVLSPELIGHYSVVTTEGAGALAVFLLALTLTNWWLDCSHRNTVWLGLTAGLALLAKFYTIPLVLLVVILVLIKTNKIRFGYRFWTSSYRPAVTVAVLSVLVLWAGYSFHTGWLTISHSQIRVPDLEPRRLWPAPSRMDISFPVPAPEFVVGVAHVSWHDELGHQSFLLGRISRHGWLLYYPIAMILKWPVIVLGLAVAGAYVLWRMRAGPPAIFFVLPATFLVLSILIGHIQIGVRHLLPAYPFLLVLAAATWRFVVSQKSKAALLVLLGLQCLDTARYAPNQLSYWNFFVPERSVHRIMTDSNTDWNQGYLALRDFQRQHPDRTLHIGPSNFGRFGIQGIRLLPGERVTGTVVVTPTQLSGQMEENPDAYRWLLQYPIVTVLDHCMYVIEVPPEHSNQHAAERNR